jgi:hypothetical protein
MRTLALLAVLGCQPAPARTTTTSSAATAEVAPVDSIAHALCDKTNDCRAPDVDPKCLDKQTPRVAKKIGDHKVAAADVKACVDALQTANCEVVLGGDAPPQVCASLVP